MRIYNLQGTTDSGGDATITVATDRGLPQLLYAVEWVDGDLADGVDAVLSVTGNLSGVDHTILTLTNANDDAWYYPREIEQDNTGTDLSTYTLPVISDTLQLVISSGGDTKTGGAIIYALEV